MSDFSLLSMVSRFEELPEGPQIPLPSAEDIAWGQMFAANVRTTIVGGVDDMVLSIKHKDVNSREGIDQVGERFGKIDWRPVSDLSSVSEIERSGYGMESQRYKGPGYIADFYHFHDSPGGGASLVVHYVEGNVAYPALAQTIDDYLQMKEATSWR